ncbi:MAG TPA: HAMP domain-containing sensor histidine kinase, partial [Thermomicrobiales bacterium]|nr:HAMP domain-containing sensor histidine kinase [Thermomicrobiales bacterium]
MTALPLPRIQASTRVRLTAWYASLLVLVLLALGVSVDTLARNRLMTDVDNRLQSTAEDIGTGIERNLASWPFSTEAVRFEDIVPTLGSFASRGLLIQITSPSGDVVRSSEYAPGDPLVNAFDEPSRDPRFVSTELNGEQARAVHFPVTVTDRDGVRWYIGAVIVGERLTTMHETLASLRQVLLVTSALGLALALAGGWVLAGRALRPVDRVTAAAAAIAAGDGTAMSLSARLPVPRTDDELSRLSATFNAMLDRLQGSFRAQERFVGDASHELRTPLTAIRGNVDVLMRQTRRDPSGLDPIDLAPALDDIRRESDRMRRLLDDLLLLARADASDGHTDTAVVRRDRVRLNEIAADAVRSAEALASGHTLELEAPRSVEIPGDADRLHQLLMILLDNAVRHTPPTGRIRVALAATPDGQARIAVRDEGEGIAPEHLPHVFERFYRADGARGRSSGGTGLGLAIAQAICRAHGGEITVSSAPGKGTTFLVTLPSDAQLEPYVGIANDRVEAGVADEGDRRNSY